MFSYQLVVLQLFGVDALRVVDGAINFPHANTFGSKPVQVPHGVQTNVPKALRADDTLHLTDCRKKE